MRWVRFSGLLASVLAVACGGSGGGPILTTGTAKLGEANPGLTAEQVASFARGKAVFERRFGLADGHGPDFNTSSCRSCHEIPTSGGSSPLYRNFSIVANRNGNVMVPVLDDEQLVARTFSYVRPMREAIPAGAQIVAQRNAPPMFGVGLFARLTNDEILANRDTNDIDGDGVSGRINVDGVLVGRFGYKAQEANMEDFVRGPIFNHMGITTDPLSFGSPQVPAPEIPTRDNDGVPDPELSFQELTDLVFYSEQLAPPQPLPLDETATNGAALFTQIGCAKCHIPNIAPSKLTVDPYTDLLLHDMGPALDDGVVMGVAGSSEFRTQPLWGLRHHAPYLHDGRADTVDDAIRLHGGEAQAIRDAYVALAAGDRDAILAFLETR